MAGRRWKATERQIAARLGNAKRVPITGRQKGDTPDIEHPILSLEAKSRQVLPAWIKYAVSQARAANKTGEKLPVVVLHEVGTRYDNDLYVIPGREFVDWFGDFIAYLIKVEGEREPEETDG